MRQFKQSLRKQFLARLADASEDQRRDWAQTIARRVLDLPEFRAAQTVLTFVSLPTEVATREIIEQAWLVGKHVAIPRVDWDRGHMHAVGVRSWSDDLRPGRMGLVEPLSGDPLDPGTIELALAPGLAFDATGVRLGRGGGFFDRFLAQHTFRGVTCGLAFEIQRVDQLPHEATDVRMDLLATEAGVFRFGSQLRIAEPSGPR